MPGIKEIKNRIEGVEDTYKLTNAMYLISSTKLRKAREVAALSRPFFDKLKNEIKTVLEVSGVKDSRYYSADPAVHDEGPAGILVITSDKGLCGAYNRDIIKKAVALAERKKDPVIFACGDYGKRYFQRNGFNVFEEFDHVCKEPTHEEARLMSEEMLTEYDNGKIKSLYAVYSDLTAGRSYEPVTTRLLPFGYVEGMHVREKGEEDETPQMEFYPGPKEVLDSLIRTYMAGYVYSVLTSGYCSEQSARMNSMSSSNKNAEELLEELCTEYHKARQAEITQEITEVCAGANAQKKKRVREA